MTFIDNMPTVAWIWDVTKLSLSSVLIQNHNIQGAFGYSFISIPVLYLHYKSEIELKFSSFKNSCKFQLALHYVIRLLQRVPLKLVKDD